MAKFEFREEDIIRYVVDVVDCIAFGDGDNFRLQDRSGEYVLIPIGICTSYRSFEDKRLGSLVMALLINDEHIFKYKYSELLGALEYFFVKYTVSESDASETVYVLKEQLKEFNKQHLVAYRDGYYTDLLLFKHKDDMYDTRHVLVIERILVRGFELDEEQPKVIKLIMRFKK
jgi:hypothetical protein